MLRGSPKTNLSLDVAYPLLSNNFKGCVIIPPLNLVASPFSTVLRGGVRRVGTLVHTLHQCQTSIFYNSNTLKREIHYFLTSLTHNSSILTMAVDAHHLSTRASSSDQSSAGVGREIMVQHLLVKEDDVKLLLELQKRIAEGEDMSDLAINYSICPSKAEAGMLGWVRRGQMVPEFEKAAFDAPVNKVVKCKTKFGWHLVQVLSQREESVLEDIQPHHLHEKLQDPCFLEEAQLIDVREPHEVVQASLPGFQVLPLRQFGNWGPEITTTFDPQKDTYVLCHHGVRSLQVAQWLQTQGFKKVFNVSGGIHAYALKADPSIPAY